MNTKTKSPQYKELYEGFLAVKQHFIYAGLFSAAVNLLMLVPIIYMMQVYDRVISSGSMPTLTMLTLLMVALLSASGGFEWVRTMILIGASNTLEKSLRRRVFDATFMRALISGGQNASAQPSADLTGLRQFLTGNGLFAFFDAPWFPIYLWVMFMFHPLFGIVGIVAGIIMVILAYWTEKSTNETLKEANIKSNAVTNRINGSLRNAEVIAAMGMMGQIRERQEFNSDQVLALQTNASGRAGLITSLSKSFRMITQSLILGLGAYLALRQEISPGMMIAGSLLLGRALAPIDMLVATWKGFSVARAQYERLGQLLEAIPPDVDSMSLPAPEGNLQVDKIMIVPPGSRTPVVNGVSFSLQAGEALAIVGPSASGKSCLARAILGIWPTASGKVRLDGADISNWNRDELGPYIGYLPQDIELFDGSIAENICRFGTLDSNKIVAAARMAGVHDLILQLPNGYDTIIGGSGGILSGGQRQRIGLARAVYDNPRLIVLDEPNSNLDDQGEKELVAAIERIKKSGSTVIVISHRTLILQAVDKMLLMNLGTQVAYGPRDQVLAHLAQKPKSVGAANSPTPV